MSRAALVILVAALAVAGCGGGEDAPSPASGGAKKPAEGEACQAAAKKIAALPAPADTDAMADYANQAADALPAGRPAVAALQDVELAAVDVKIRRLHAKLDALRSAAADCGEREAFDRLAAPAYAFGLDDALENDHRLGRKPPPAGDLATDFRYDVLRMREMVERMQRLAVPSRLEHHHSRFVHSLKAFGVRSNQAAQTPSRAHFPALKRLAARRDRALRRLDRALDRLLDD